jgi:NADPH2:quinone reductase
MEDLMKAIVTTENGGPEVLKIRELPDPDPSQGEVLIRVKAFGVNHAETHMRKGEWPEATPVSGIEAVGTVVRDPSGALADGATVATVMGGLGRSRNGSYAELVVAAISNVVPIESALSWTDLAAIPESYATAWSTVHGNLELGPQHTLLVRGPHRRSGRPRSTSRPISARP